VEKPDEIKEDEMTAEELYIYRCSKCSNKTCTDRRVPPEPEPEPESESEEEEEK